MICCCDAKKRSFVEYFLIASFLFSCRILLKTFRKCYCIVWFFFPYLVRFFLFCGNSRAVTAFANPIWLPVFLLLAFSNASKCEPKIVPDVSKSLLLWDIDWFVCVYVCVCVDTYSGKSPSTRHTYCFCTWRFRIWCSIWRAFFGLRPNSRRPDVRRSKRWIVRKFFKLNSFARMKTTVLWR